MLSCLLRMCDPLKHLPVLIYEYYRHKLKNYEVCTRGQLYGVTPTSPDLNQLSCVSVLRRVMNTFDLSFSGLYRFLENISFCTVLKYSKKATMFIL